jgi:hypothetical protein
MFTHPDEIEELGRARARRYLTGDEFAEYETSVAERQAKALKIMFVAGGIVLAVLGLIKLLY